MLFHRIDKVKSCTKEARKDTLSKIVVWFP